MRIAISVIMVCTMMFGCAVAPIVPLNEVPSRNDLSQPEKNLWTSASAIEESLKMNRPKSKDTKHVESYLNDLTRNGE